MKKTSLIVVIFLLILSTTIIKNSAKQIEDEIFTVKENLRVLQDKYELVMLEYNYLTSPKKLMEYQKKYFDNELLEADIESLNWVEIKNKEIIINKIVSNNE